MFHNRMIVNYIFASLSCLSRELCGDDGRGLVLAGGFERDKQYKEAESR